MPPAGGKKLSSSFGRKGAQWSQVQILSPQPHTQTKSPPRNRAGFRTFRRRRAGRQSLAQANEAPMTVIDCEGEAPSVGRAHGEGARSLVRAGLARWEDAVVRPSKRGIERYVTEILSGSGFLAGTQAAAPRLIEEIRGIAEGAGVSFETLFAYNLMDEQWWFDRERLPLEPPGCSVIAAAPMSNRPGLLAQNMDLPAFMDGSQLLLRVRGGGRPEQLVLTAAGVIGLTGVNRP